MALFSKKGLFFSILTIAIVLIINSFGQKIKNAISPQTNEDELIRKYLLNESPLYGYNRPKLWIHTTYEYNARKWKSFGSRSSTDLNQPYIHLTIKTIINQCSDDFNVCLIDDDSFNQLIPGWKINISELPEPQKHNFRELAMMELLYIYGGMIVPNSFICLRNLISIYTDGLEKEKAFVFEEPTHHVNLINSSKHHVFSPNPMFIGAEKRSPIIHDLIDYLKTRNNTGHFSAESDFFGYTSKWISNEIRRNHIYLFDGIYVGTKTIEKKPVLIENLLSEEQLDFCKRRTYGIVIPSEELLKRTNYNWFAIMSSNEILDSNLIVSQYLIQGLKDNNQKKIEDLSKTVVSI